MSASICSHCQGGYVAFETADGDFACLSCGHVVYRNLPLNMPLPNRRHLGFSSRDKLRGTKPNPKSLAPNPGGAKG